VTRLTAAAAVAALVLGVAAAEAKRAPVLAMVWKGNVVSLTRVDPMSLQPVGGPSPAIGGGAYRVARSPRGVTLAFDTDRGAVLSFVDAGSLRVRGSVRLGDGWIAAAAWPTARRLVAVIGSEGYPKVVTVDPVTRRVLSERLLPFRGGLLGAAAIPGGVAFLLAEADEIAPVQVGVAGGDGVLRTVVLDRILGGTRLPSDFSTAAVGMARPGLAVEPSGARAAVVGADGLVAEVDLVTLGVAYHPRALRAPARAGKTLEGWQRSAVWLSSGLLAVTGMEYRSGLRDGVDETTGTPAGVTLVDTADWTSRTVADGASLVARAGSGLVAFGGPLGPSAAGIGLLGYGPDGTQRFHLFGSEPIGDARVAGGLVYVAGCNDRCFRIVDPANGEVLATPTTERATELLPIAS
jgi:hypothetical protein